MLEQVIAGIEVVGRYAVERVPNLREAVGRWARRAPAELQPITVGELQAAILAAGVERGRDLLVHASWAGMQRMQATPGQVVTMLREVVGPNATLLMPTHAVEKMRDGVLIYDVDRSPSRMGLLSESMRRVAGAIRGPFPVAPVSALGPSAAEYTRDYRGESAGTPWGRGSPYWRLGERRGQVLVLGIDFVRTLTLMHCAFDVLQEANPIADFYEDVEYVVIHDRREERWTVRRQRRELEKHLATFAFRRLALRSGSVRESTLKGARIAVVDASAFLTWHLPLARSTGLPYWGFRRA